jgi:hypothetical protein
VFHRAVTAAGLAGLALSGSLAGASTTPPASRAPRAGDWPVYRGDTRLTGRASLPGDSRQAPTVAWRYPVEAGQAWITIDPVSGVRSRVATSRPADELADYLQSAEGRRWGAGPKLVDLHGDGRLVPDPGQAAKLLPDVPGLQTVAFVPVPDAPGLDPKQAVCYAHDGGTKREVWRSEVFDTVQNTNFTIADVDHDGKLEIAFAPHYRVIVLDGQSGRTKHLLKIHDYRNYGFFCCTDLNADGLLDFVVIADFAMHLDVVLNEGDHLRLLWRRDIEHDIQSKQRIIRPGPNPVLDINGDGRKEIIANLFNDTGDGKWHVVAWDALHGDPVLDLPAAYLHGSADVDGDGTPELFVAHTDGLYLPEAAALRLLRVRGREVETLWRHPRGRWVTEPHPLAPTHTTIVARGTDDVVTAALDRHGRRAFFVLEQHADGRDQLTAYAVGQDGRVSTQWRLALPERSRPRLRHCADIDDDGQEEVLLTIRQQDTRAVRLGPADSARARVVALEKVGVSNEALGAGEVRPVVAAAMAPGGPRLVLCEGADNDILALAPPSRPGEAPRLRWRLPGAGPVVLADLKGDGSRCALFANWAETGEGEMVAADARGRRVWRRRIAGFPGPHPPWNLGGITTWWAGRFSDPNRDDVWVSARRSTMHSDEAWVLRGRDGAPLWHLREVRTNATPAEGRGWGAGGSFVCAADVDGDGLEDVVSLYPVNYMAAKGTTGALIHSIEAASGLFEGVWGAYCQPIVTDCNGDGVEEILWCGPYHHGLTTLDCRVLWVHPGGASTAGLGDVDGDGKLELGFTGWERGKGLRCLDAATGAQKWEWPLADNPRALVYTADVDGDGCEEFVFAVGTTLYAVNGRGGAPHVVWQASLPAAPGTLAFADTDNDGAVEILFLGTDSVIYCME